MGYRTLIGREAMTNRVLIDPDSSFWLDTVSNDEVKKHYGAISTEIKRNSKARVIL